MQTRLVLSRKPGEKVIITTAEGDIIVTLVSLTAGLVRLAFDSPKHIPINREEIARKKGIYRA